MTYLLGQINPKKVVLGISNFGRQYTVAGQKSEGVLGEATETNSYVGPYLGISSMVHFYEVYDYF